MSNRKLTYTIFYGYDSMVNFINVNHFKREDIQQIIVNRNQIVVFWWELEEQK